jgi:hypothetical protein
MYIFLLPRFMSFFFLIYFASRPFRFDVFLLRKIQEVCWAL